MSSQQISTEKFDAELRATFVVSSEALGGKVLSCSDDFFASKDNLIKPSASISLKGQFGPNGALYDGWESRRHNPTYDWAIIKLAPASSHLYYVDIDTSHFSGNEAPYASVFALSQDSSSLSPTNSPGPNDPRWEEILPVVELGPSQRHIFQLGKKAVEGKWSVVMVRMIPDGGMARFRAYGRPVPPIPLTALPDEASTPPINLLSPLAGAHIVSCSDANFSPPGNLLLPGRGVDMSDGWETRRSQENRGKYAKGGALEGQERKEWVVAKLAGTGVIKYVEVDTAFHPGNYPMACAVEATLCDEVSPPESQKWTTIVAKKPLGAHRQHWLDIERDVSPSAVYSHIRLSIFPDGGLKRLRVFGHPLAPSAATTPSGPLTIPALPLTAEAFKPYGDVIQGYSLPTSAPKGVETTIANQGTAFKFNREASIAETYPAGMLKLGGMGIGCVRGMPFFETRNGAILDVKMLERHACTSQAFIPMGKGTSPGTKALPSGGGFVVVAALNGKDDKPDLSTLRAFLATAAQGVNFHQGIWHHHLWTVDAPMDYACVEAQVGDPGLVLDCEIVKPVDVFCKVTVAPYTSVDPDVHSHIANGHAHHEHHHPGALETLSHLLPTLPPAIEHSLHADSLIHPTPITPEAFAPYGNLILAYPDEATRPGAMIVTGSLKTGKAEKYTRLAAILSTYPKEANAVTSIGVYRATKKVGLERGKVFDIRLMERHPFTTQAFIPMGKAGWEGYGEEALPKGGAFLVIVAKNGHDPTTIKSFIVESSMALSYAAGTWHHPVLVLDSTLDLACIETQIHTGLRESDPRDCELIELKGEEVFGRIAVPVLEAEEA